MAKHRLFERELGTQSARHADIWRNYEILYHINDFVAGLLFVFGSALFFWKSTERAALWLFLLGSVLFTLRPAIRLLRDFHLMRLPPES